MVKVFVLQTKRIALQAVLQTDTDIRQRLWTELQRATHDRHHAWRTPVLATVDAAGWPQARTVVLRLADARLGQLQIYTDSRSPKVADIAATPKVALTFWSKRLSWQLRVQAVAAVQLAGPAVDEVWARVSQSAAAGDYLSAHAPGDALPDHGTTPASSSSPQPLLQPQPSHHLAIITAQVQAMDWLELSRNGHRRAVLTADRWAWRVP